MSVTETRAFGLHRLRQRLSDKLKIDKYQKAFDANFDSFHGKVVLDVECGSGLLSMMAVKAGAVLVIGVDTHSVLHVTERIVEVNQMTDKILIVKSRIEDLILPHGLKQVDVIISDCVQPSQIQGSSLAAVLLARDRFLRAGGLMFPDTVSLNMTAIDDHQYNDKLLSFWNSVYGINMTAMADKERREPRLLNVEEDQMRTNKIILQEIDMNTVKVTDIQLTSPFHLEVLKKGYIRGIALHYSVGFTSGRERIQYPEKDKASKQSVLFLKDFLICSSGDDLVGLITMEHTERGVRINLSGVKLKGQIQQEVQGMDFAKD